MTTESQRFIATLAEAKCRPTFEVCQSESAPGWYACASYGSTASNSALVASRLRTRHRLGSTKNRNNGCKTGRLRCAWRLITV